MLWLRLLAIDSSGQGFLRKAGWLTSKSTRVGIPFTSHRKKAIKLLVLVEINRRISEEGWEGRSRAVLGGITLLPQPGWLHVKRLLCPLSLHKPPGAGRQHLAFRQ